MAIPTDLDKSGAPPKTKTYEGPSLGWQYSYPGDLTANPGTSGQVWVSNGDGTAGWATLAAAPVTSVFGRTGAVVAATNDYGFTQLSGNIAVSQMNSGTGASSSTFWRGDGTWAAVSASPGGSSKQLQYNNAGAFGGANVWRTGADQLDISDAATAQAFRVYNKTDNDGGAPTNAEWFAIDFVTNPNVATVGTVGSGTGGARELRFVSFFTNFYSNGTQLLTLDTNNARVGVCNGQSLSFASNTSSFTAGLNKAADGVLTATDGVSNNRNGWWQWQGESRVSSDFSVTSNTTLANVTGLTSNLQAGRTYSFEAWLFFSTGASAGGIKVALGGTATVTNLIADANCVDGTTVIAGTQVSALGTNIIANTNAGTTPKAVIAGTITVNAAGTFTIQFAQNASSGTASVVKRGSYMIIQDMP